MSVHVFNIYINQEFLICFHRINCAGMKPQEGTIECHSTAFFVAKKQVVLLVTKYKRNLKTPVTEHPSMTLKQMVCHLTKDEQMETQKKREHKFCIFCCTKLPVVAKFCSSCGESQIIE